MSDALSARIVRAIGNYGMAVGRGEHALNEEILEIVRDVAELERQLAEATEAVTALSKGKPLGPVVGAQTIINQQAHIKKIEAQLAEVNEYATKLEEAVEETQGANQCACIFDASGGECIRWCAFHLALKKDAERYQKLAKAGWIDDAIMERYGIKDGDKDSLDVAIDSITNRGEQG